MHRSVDPWNLGPQIAPRSSDCRVSEAFTIDTAGAKPLDLNGIDRRDHLNGGRR